MELPTSAGSGYAGATVAANQVDWDGVDVYQYTLVTESGSGLTWGVAVDKRAGTGGTIYYKDGAEVSSW